MKHSKFNDRHELLCNLRIDGYRQLESCKKYLAVTGDVGYPQLQDTLSGAAAYVIEQQSVEIEKYKNQLVNLKELQTCEKNQKYLALASFFSGYLKARGDYKDLAEDDAFNAAFELFEDDAYNAAFEWLDDVDDNNNVFSDLIRKIKDKFE